MRAAIVRLIKIGFAAAWGFVSVWVVTSARHSVPRMANFPFLAENVPLPHQVSEYAGGISFRLAMVHDVIHERFPRHGAAYYREREKITWAKLAVLDPDDPAGFPLRDDLAAGLERLGKSAEAVEVMRDKLARQRAKGINGRDLYTSFANLGTFLIHASFKAAMGGDSDAKKQFREGVELIRESVKVNPEAHFGRERWQAAIAEFLLAAMDNPTLLGTYDCLGNRLDIEIRLLLNREETWVTTGFGRPYDVEFAQGKVHAEVPEFYAPGVDLDDPSLWPTLSKIRRHITKVGAEPEWEAVPVPSHRAPAPFDEPMLGIIGMWRQGGGANPHFCLAMGETMLRVGQRYIAWEAFERAQRLADRFWPDEGIRQSLRDHCRKRQAQIEETLSFRSSGSSSYTPWQSVSPPPEPETIAKLRADFDAELAIGEGYQRAYQAYEEAKIGGGAPIIDEHFFDEFLSGRPPIASETGSEEWFVEVPRVKIARYSAESSKAWGILGAGIGAFCASLWMWLAQGWKLRKPVAEMLV